MYGQRLKIKDASEYILQNTLKRPKIGIILGSGLGDYAESLENVDYLEYKKIPHFPVSTIQGHKGRFVISDDVICMQGRFHFYEGYPMKEVTIPIRVMKKIGIEKLIITNAAGGVNTDFNAGDLMIIQDHINFMGANPLMGRNNDDFGDRFPDMSEAYDKDMIKITEDTANKIGIDIKKGVYMAFSGPSYETPAEVKMSRILGADAVGMSTVPEVIVANHSGIKVLGISCITNMAAGVLNKPLTHEEVIENSSKSKDKFIKLINELLKKL